MSFKLNEYHLSEWNVKQCMHLFAFIDPTQQGIENRVKMYH